jgi:hypothetical protein
LIPLTFKELNTLVIADMLNRSITLLNEFST